MVKLCVICREPHASIGNRKVCDSTCCKMELKRKQPSWRRKLEKRKAELDQRRLAKQCAECANPIPKGRSKFCCTGCALPTLRRQQREFKRRNFKSRAKDHRRECAVCSAPFIFHGRGVRKTCGPACSDELERITTSKRNARPEVRADLRQRRKAYGIKIGNLINALRAEAPDILEKFGL